MKTRKPIASEEIRQRARFKLFVEGDTIDGFDATVLKAHLEDSISIEVMGPSYYIKSAAEALINAHPDYFFLVDRDETDEKTIEESWKTFTDRDKLNLLYWRRKEIENYFLIPDFICSSEYFTGDKKEYIKKLEEEATKRVYFDTANFVISIIRNRLKRNWITCFKRLEDFHTKEDALQQLINQTAFEKRKKKTEEIVSRAYIKNLFESKIVEMIGTETRCVWGTGRWDYFLSGKELLNRVINPGMFTIKDRNNKILQGKRRLIEIARALVKRGENLPDDFIKLKQLISSKINM
jgi:hypothetical protein